MREDTVDWIECAKYDLATARDLLEAGRNPYVIFFCHLTLEKMLKAHVAAVTKTFPPKTHSLVHLAKLAGLEMPSELLPFLGEMENGSARPRYPGKLARLLAESTHEVAERCLRSTEKVLEWLENHRNLRT